MSITPTTSGVRSGGREHGGRWGVGDGRHHAGARLSRYIQVPNQHSQHRQHLRQHSRRKESQ